MEQEEESRNHPVEEMSLDSHSFVQTQGNFPERIGRDESELENEQQHGLDETEVHVLYLNVPASDEPQVLDLSNILVHEGIQVIESSDHGDHISGTTHIHTGHDIVIGNDSVTEVAMVTSQSETQPASALVGLAKSQADDSHVEVSDILAAHRHTEHVMSEQEQNTSAEALLQLSSDQNTATYIMDETGTMIPLSQMRSGTLLEVEDTGMTTIAICQCWCGREFISQEDLSRHKLAHKYQMQSKVNPGAYKCTLCMENFLSNKDLRAHHTEIHPGGLPWECSICHRTFQKKIAMKAHMRVHNTITRYQCSSCKKFFFYKNALNRHLKMHSCEKPFKCTICGDAYNSLWDLRKHRMNHQPPKLFSCDICTKVFKQKQTLFVHSRIHTGQKPYTCVFCHRYFSLKSTLVQHQRIHTGEKPNVCHICQRAFRQNSTLKAHLKTHTNLKPYMCRYCKMRFAYKDEVTEHEHTHAQNKTWQCEECGMWFKNQSLLARHSRVHTNERPFHCKICFKSFVQSGSLQSHLRSHTKEKPYKCRICSKAYYTSGTLLVHIRKFHNVDAKSVKEVFPVYNYIEDQKVFTIRNSLQGDLKHSNLDIDDGDDDSGADKSHIDDLIAKDNSVVKEELVEMSDEIIVQDGGVIDGKVISTTFAGDETEIVSMEVSDRISSVHKSNKDVEKMVGKEINRVEEQSEDNDKNVILDCAQTEVLCELHTEDAGPVEMEALQSSHAALDRQEAALGLAELSLIGGEGMHLEKCPQTKTRTFFKEEEEDENDPNVTKIILSKEGGIMNSQDPHQCPVCGRIFGRKSIMIEHIRIHTDEKPYQCDFCQASFRQNAQLRSHIRNNHTQVERYQCSFCHNRFLSRSITIRHISFHHKLKIKFCQNMDPAWTIDNAVWSDDSFELNVNNPQFLKVNKKKINKDKGNNNTAAAVSSNSSVNNTAAAVSSNSSVNNTAAAVTSNSDVNQHVDSAHGDGVHDKYVITVSVQSPERDTGVPSKTVETVCEDNPSEKSEQHSVHTMNSLHGNITHENIASVGDDIPSSSGISANDCSPLSDVASERNNVSTPTKTAGGNAVLETHGNSLLFCNMCAMQFRGVSKIMNHLRKMHKKTGDQSELSSLYSSSTQNMKHQIKTDTQAQTVNQRNENSREGVSLGKTSENGTVKVVVFDDSKKCVDEPSKLNLSHVCPMCSQWFGSKMSLDEHFKSHSEEDVESVGLHRCDICTSVMKNTQQVTKHIIKVHGVKQIYVCSICNREFYQQSSVYRHMKFLHKWEIKIRGEASIPVFVKPAPSSMHSPVTNTAGLRVRRDSFSEDMKSPAAKLISDADNVTYISVETGGVENLNVYKVDGQEVIFEVVDCDGTMTTLKIQDDGSDTVEAEAKLLEAIEKALRNSSETVHQNNDLQLTCTQETRLASGEDQTDATTVTTEAGEESFHSKTATSEGGTSSFVIVGDDKSTQFSATKELISHLFAALKNTAHDKNTSLETPQVFRVKNVKHALSINEPDAVNVDGDFKETAESKYTSETNEAVPRRKSARLPDSASFKPPIIMSVRDIGATYANCGTRLGQRNTSETNLSKTSTGENTNMKVLSASKAPENVNKNNVKKLEDLTGIKMETGHDKVRNPLGLEGSEKNVQNLQFTTNFPGKIKEDADAVKLEQVHLQNVVSEMLINKKGESFVSTSGSEALRTRSMVPLGRIQSKHSTKESVNIGLDTSDKTIKQKHRSKSPTKEKVTKTSDISHNVVLSEFISAEDNISVPAKVKGLRSSIPKSAFVTKHATQPALSSKIASSQLTPSCKKASSQLTSSCKRPSSQLTPSCNKISFGDMPRHTVDKNRKHGPHTKASEKSGQMESALVHRSSSGRVIKRKRFDDEI